MLCKEGFKLISTLVESNSIFIIFNNTCNNLDYDH
jgi:hypothetical protein